MNKKIGILTFHNAYNFGANLQAYALKNYLIDKGYEVEIIDYHNSRLKKKYGKELSPWFATRKRDWIMPWRWKNIVASWKWYRKAKEDWKCQAEKFILFQKKYLNYTEKGIPVNEISRKNFDVILFGSDQIWDTGITGKKEQCYWGNFKCSAKKVAYAASLYGKKITKTEEENIKKYLKNFDFISVREKHLADRINKITGKKVEIVCDPTLLLPTKKYFELFEKKSKNVQKYTLVYAVSEDDEIIKIAQQYGNLVRVLHYYSFQVKPENVDDIAYAGPSQFLELLYGAEAVVTNSYHGTVFSILFQKPFVAVYNENARIDNLLKIVGLENAHYRNGNRLAKSELNNIEKLNEYTEISKKFLERCVCDA